MAGWNVGRKSLWFLFSKTLKFSSSESLLGLPLYFPPHLSCCSCTFCFSALKLHQIKLQICFFLIFCCCCSQLVLLLNVSSSGNTRSFGSDPEVWTDCSLFLRCLSLNQICNRYLVAQGCKKLFAAFFKIDQGEQSAILQAGLPSSWAAWKQTVGHLQYSISSYCWSSNHAMKNMEQESLLTERDCWILQTDKGVLEMHRDAS